MAKQGDAGFIYWFKDLGIQDVPLVGGKNASLGEMFAKLTDKGVRVPNGFAVSAQAYNYYIDSTGLRAEIDKLLRGLDHHDVDKLGKTGEAIRNTIRAREMPADLREAILAAYDDLSRQYGGEVDTAVRSSATAEDLPDASFAGQQDTYLNISGHAQLLEACRNCFASLFTNRAIAYRQEKDFDHFQVALSIAVQKMVRSDLAAAGVMFSIDTESGFKDAVYITGGYGLGENVVQGSINPDEFYVHKPTLARGKRPVIYAHLGEKQQKMIYVDQPEPGGEMTKNIPVPPEEAAQFCIDEEEVLTLARWADIIEKHYSDEAGYFKPMDMEWAKDGQTGDLFIVQARPETVHSRRETGVIRRRVLEKTSRVLAEGMAVGDAIGTGPAHVIKSSEQIGEFKSGSVLVTEMTDPDWVPIMKIASAIVTDQGGRTCHAAIISRELGIPCIVGTGNGSQAVKDGADITVSCAGGAKGTVYDGILPYHEEVLKLAELKMPKTRFWFHQSAPDRAFPDAAYPSEGVGLLRVDEVVREEVKVHPLAALAYSDWKTGGEEAATVKKIEDVSLGYPDKRDYWVTRLAQGIGRIAAAMYPRPVRLLLSDATTSQMAGLIGGKAGEIGMIFNDPNPLLGARGAARYGEFEYESAVEMELEAIARVRNDMGMENLSIVLPAAQSEKELKALSSLLSRNGLKRGDAGLEHHLLCRTPAQMLALELFADHVDGFLVDVRELAQLTQGIDLGSMQAREYFVEDHPALLTLLETGALTARKLKKPMGLTNIAPAKLRDFAAAPAVRAADYVVIRPELFDDAREVFLEAEST